MVAGGDISHTAVVPAVYLSVCLSVCLSLCCFISPPIYLSLLLNYILAFHILVSAFFSSHDTFHCKWRNPTFGFGISLKWLDSIASSQVSCYSNEICSVKGIQTY